MKEETLQFLRVLSRNNSRDWFTENKSLYLSAQQNVIDFIESLIKEIAQFDEEIEKVDPKKSLFRIYRDTRFSLDKTPYKTNFGASLGMGKGNQKAGYYLHIEPGKSFLAGGLYMPEKDVLKNIRKEIALFPEEFKPILEHEEFRRNFRGLSVEGKLKRVPNGFEKEDPMAEYLKLKHFIVSHPISDKELLNKDAPKKFAEILKSVKPLNDYLNSIISNS